MATISYIKLLLFGSLAIFFVIFMLMSEVVMLFAVQTAVIPGGLHMKSWQHFLNFYEIHVFAVQLLGYDFWGKKHKMGLNWQFEFCCHLLRGASTIKNLTFKLQEKF